MTATPAPTKARQPLRRHLATGLLTCLALGGYTLLVSYDIQVWRVAPSLWRYVRVPVDPALAEALPEPLPDDPVAIEALVKRLLPWAPDHAVFGLPWYFPTPAEALAAGRGDCEAAAVVLASLLAAQDVPFSFRASFSHIWVDYPGRPRLAGETAEEAMMHRVDGRYRFRWPRMPRLADHLASQRELLWDPLATWRKVLLLGGWPLLAVGVPWKRATTWRDAEHAQPTAGGSPPEQ